MASENTSAGAGRTSAKAMVAMECERIRTMRFMPAETRQITGCTSKISALLRSLSVRNVWLIYATTTDAPLAHLRKNLGVCGRVGIFAEKVWTGKCLWRVHREAINLESGKASLLSE